MNLYQFTAMLAKLPVRHRDSNKMVPFRLFPNQVTAMKKLGKQYEDKRKIRAIFLKSRRVTVSSLCDSYLFCDCLSAPNRENLIVAHVADTSKGLFRVPRDLANALPLPSGYCVVQTKNIQINHREGVSTLDIATAGTISSGRGLTLTGLHLCLAPDSLIARTNGNLEPISKLSVRDNIVTHSGRVSMITGISYRPAEDVSPGGRCICIRTWLNCETLTVTPDHKVWTQRGWVPARELSVLDYVGTPIREYEYPITQFKIAPRVRVGNRGKFTKSGIFKLTEETGFFVGYYLAEGSIKKQSKGPKLPASIDLARHQDEKAFAERAANAVAKFSTKITHKDRGGKKSHTSIYGASLALFVQRYFGEKDDKAIPDWVLSAAPHEFKRGLILGYLAGDGSKGIACHGGYECPTIYVTSVRPRLVYQLRHLLATLGWGWGGITKKPAFVDSRGWNCRAAWTLSINGRAAMNVRRASHRIEAYDSKRRDSAAKYKIENGCVWTRIKELSEAKSEFVWDIEVGDPDHSFDTVIGAVANSEAAFYPGQDSFLSLLPAVSEGDDTSVFVETTANGTTGEGETFYDFWQSAVERRNGYIPIFLGWLTDPACVDDPANAEDAPATDLERELMRDFKATKAHISWMRMTLENKCQGYEKKFLQEYPHTEGVAFISTNDPAFTPEEINFAKTTVREPIAQGHMEWKSGEPRFVRVRDGALSIWEEPKRDHKYYLGMDAAVGIETGDFAAICVWDGTTGRQVAQYADKVVPEVCAFMVHCLGHYYNRAMTNGELTGNSGREVLRILRDHYHYPFFAMWKGKDDKLLGRGENRRPTVWWETTAYSRAKMFDVFRVFVRGGMKPKESLEVAIVRDPALHGQMSRATLSTGGRWEVEKGHDDILVSAMLAIIALAQNPVPRHLNQSHVIESGEPEADRIANLIPNLQDDVTLSLQRHYKKAMLATRKSEAKMRREGGMNRLIGV